MTNLDVIMQLVAKGDHEQTVNQVKEALVSGMAAKDILQKGLVPGIQSLGELFRQGQVFLPEILISVRAMNRGLEELRPHLTDTDVLKKGTVVLGTVEGDLHDIGKNLVRMMLEGAGYHVIDLGVDVGADTFVRVAKERKADIVAMSSLLTTTMLHSKTVVEALREEGLKGKVKVLLGGAPVTRSYADEIEAEGYADDCVTAVDEADRL